MPSVMELIFVLLSIFGTFVSAQPYTEVNVTTTLGVLIGAYDANTKLTQFWGVPYAKPPVKELRWKPPVALQPGSDKVRVRTPGPACMQPIMKGVLRLKRKLIFLDPDFEVLMPEPMSEDCLFMNIFIPGTIKPNAKLPVMIWIHPGGSYIGNGKIYIPNKLAPPGVIVVTLNYRLGIFGFYFPEYLGNLGLLDQRMAMRVVKENIQYMGGDPNKITIFGQGFGGASVNAHMTSARSSPYFSQAISQSGVISHEYATYTHMHRQERYKAMAKSMSCYTESDKPDKQQVDEIIPCMKKLDAKKLLEIEIFGELLYGADNDTIMSDKNAVLKQKFSYTQKPYLFGVCEFEAASYLYAMLGTIKEKLDRHENMNEYFEGVLKEALRFALSPDHAQTVIEATMKYYGIKDNRGVDAFLEFSKAMGDIIMVQQEYKDWNAFSKESKVYVYQMMEADPVGHYDLYHKYGAAFGDDTNYMWGNTGHLNSKQKQLSEVMIRAFTNFAKTGDPNPLEDGSKKWKPWTKSDQDYIQFDTDDGPVVERKRFREKYMKLWAEGNEKLWGDLYRAMEEDKKARGMTGENSASTFKGGMALFICVLIAVL